MHVHNGYKDEFQICAFFSNFTMLVMLILLIHSNHRLFDDVFRPIDTDLNSNMVHLLPDGSLTYTPISSCFAFNDLQGVSQG